MFIKSTFLAVGLMSVVTLSFAHTEKQVPTEHKGVSADVVAVLPLGEQIPEMKGFQLRVRKFTIEGDGAVANHEHSTRPGVAYILSGNFIEFKEGKTKPLNMGDASIEDASTVHGMRNNSASAGEILGIDIVPIK